MRGRAAIQKVIIIIFILFLILLLFTVSHVTELHKYITEKGSLPHLLSQGSLTGTNRNGDTCLHVAARYGHTSLLRELHAEYGLGLNVFNNEGKSPLHESAQNGHTECIEYLINEGHCCVDTLKRGDW